MGPRGCRPAPPGLAWLKSAYNDPDEATSSAWWRLVETRRTLSLSAGKPLHSGYRFRSVRASTSISMWRKMCIPGRAGRADRGWVDRHATRSRI